MFGKCRIILQKKRYDQLMDYYKEKERANEAASRNSSSKIKSR